MYRIHTLIDPETGELIPYTPDLAALVQELRELMQAMVKAQAQRDLFRIEAQRRPRDLKPVGVGDGEKLAEALFRPLQPTGEE